MMVVVGPCTYKNDNNHLPITMLDGIMASLCNAQGSFTLHFPHLPVMVLLDSTLLCLSPLYFDK